MPDKMIQEKYKNIDLMPFQWEPFNADTHLEDHFAALAVKHRPKLIIELGTCLGSSTLFLSGLAPKVITTEIHKPFADIAKERFAEEKATNITLYNEDSRSILDMIIPSEGPVIIFIDSHWGDSNPLLQELDIIAQSGNKNVILAIHDFKVPEHPELGWDEYARQGIVYEWNWIESRIEKIYGKGNFTHWYNSEAVGAKRGVVFIEPKI